MSNSPAPTTAKTTPELRQGDVVVTHGLRCLVDRPVESRNGTYWTNALVLNRDDVDNASVPRSWTTTAFYPSRGLPAEPEGTHRWSIQGASFVKWSVEA